ncbi:hypothetical protein ACIQWR_14395 [Streptomyces sp. NPDC098789]|uniref:hypothetical protein n=1 Tax=Streptomyces sp. NPDC098789 TaxID=3366098 RepID=UPI0038026E45
MEVVTVAVCRGVVRIVVALGLVLAGAAAQTGAAQAGVVPAGAGVERAGAGAVRAGAGAVRADAWRAPEADVSYRGRVKLSAGRLAVWVVPENQGPAPLANTTLRLRFSAALADGQELAEGCARAGQREVMCETGALPAHGPGRHIGLRLWLKERPSEVVVRVDTWWNGGANDRNHANDEHTVLALDTGDSYSF